MCGISHVVHHICGTSHIWYITGVAHHYVQMFMWIHRWTFHRPENSHSQISEFLVNLIKVMKEL